MPKQPKHRLERKSATTQIAESLRRRISEHEFSESEPIRQERLAEEYGVSIAPIREALAKLESEGLLTLLRHRGYVVTSLTVEDIRQLYQLRAVIEAELLRSALEHPDPESFAKAEELLEKMNKAYKKGRQTGAWTDLNWQFHCALYEPSQKAQYRAIADNIYTNIDRYIHMQLAISHSVVLPRSIEEHRRLLDYCEAGESERACELLRKHIMRAADDLVAFLQQRQKDAAHADDEGA